MADINQRLGVDASQALQQIDQFNRRIAAMRTSLTSIPSAAANANRALLPLATTLERIRRASGATITLPSVPTPPPQPTVPAGAAGAGINQSTAAANNLNNALNQAGQTGQGTAQQLTVSFQSLARIITAQLVQRAIGALINGLQQARQANVEFVQSVSAIQTIDPDNRSFDDFASSIRSVSDAFNLDLIDTAGGLYQTISQQIAVAGDSASNAAGQLQFLNSAAALGTAGISDLESTVTLLGGTLNAFGEGAEFADIRASQLFRTVELGRTTIPELAQSLGQVSPLARVAGVSLEELLGSLATLTNRGIDTSKAITQLRGIFNAFIKPTTELSEAIKQLGFENAEALIATEGFTGAIQAVAGTTDGTAEAFGDLFPRIRGISGVLTILSDDAEQANQNIEKIRDTSADLAQTKADLVLSTNAAQVEKALNSLSNTLTTELGDAINDTLVNFTQFTSQADFAIRVLARAVPIITAGAVPAVISLTAALTANRLAALGASQGLTTFVASAGRLAGFAGLGLALGLLAREAGQQAGEALVRGWNERVQNLTVDTSAEIEKANDEALKKVQEGNREIEDSAKELSRALRNINKERTQDAIDAANAFADASRSGFDKIVSASEKLTRDLRSSSENRIREADRSADRQRDTAQELADFQFESNQRRLSDQQRFFQQEQRLDQQRRQARQAIQRAAQTGDEGDFEAAQDALERAEESARALDSLGQNLGGGLAVRGQNAVTAALKLRIQQEKILEQTLRQRAEQEAEDAKKSEENTKALQEAILRQQELADRAVSQTDDPQALSQTRQEALKNAQEIRDLIRQQQGLSISDFTSLADQASASFIGQLNKNLTGAELTAVRDIGKQFDQLIENALGIQQERALAIPVNLQLQLQAAGFEGPLTAENISSFFGDLTANREQAFKINTDLSTAEQEIKEASESFKNILEDSVQIESGTFARAFAQATGEIAGIDLGLRETIQQQVEDAASGVQLGGTQGEQLLGRLLVASFNEGDFSQEMSQRIQNALSRINVERGGTSTFELGVDQLLGQGQNDAALEKLIEQFIRLRDASKQASDARQEAERFEQETGVSAADFVDNDGFSQLQTNIDQAIARVGTLTEAQDAYGISVSTGARLLRDVDSNAQTAATGGVSQLTRQTQAFASAAERGNTALQNASNLGAGGGPGRQFGGAIRRFQTGGFSGSGIDTIPAFLSPGEFVVNRRSTSRFFSQLQALNSGQSPVFRQDGGSVTNFGDINVTVPESEVRDGDRIARSLLRRITREQRKGNFK